MANEYQILPVRMTQKQCIDTDILKKGELGWKMTDNGICIIKIGTEDNQQFSNAPELASFIPEGGDGINVNGSTISLKLTWTEVTNNG